MEEEGNSVVLEEPTVAIPHIPRESMDILMRVLENKNTKKQAMENAATIQQLEDRIVQLENPKKKSGNWVMNIFYIVVISFAILIVLSLVLQCTVEELMKETMKKIQLFSSFLHLGKKRHRTHKFSSWEKMEG